MTGQTARLGELLLHADLWGPYIARLWVLHILFTKCLRTEPQLGYSEIYDELD